MTPEYQCAQVELPPRLKQTVQLVMLWLATISLKLKTKFILQKASNEQKYYGDFWTGHITIQ